MRALLDVNVLIALLDAGHASHRAAADWFETTGVHGWASCPITQNGCVRIMSSPAYPDRKPVAAIAERLREATLHASHEFWAESLSLLDPRRIDFSHLHGPRQLTDAYLLALAVEHGGRFVTFDRAVPSTAVIGATSAHLLVL